LLVELALAGALKLLLVYRLLEAFRAARHSANWKSTR
jgi:hypothetical protein